MMGMQVLNAIGSALLVRRGLRLEGTTSDTPQVKTIEVTVTDRL